MKPIIENEKDQRTYEWLLTQVGDDAIKVACQKLAGKRKPYLSSILKILGLTVPEQVVRTPPKVARQNLAAMLEMLEKKEH